jgi:hypothetical protein
LTSLFREKFLTPVYLFQQQQQQQQSKQVVKNPMSETKQREEQRELERQVEELKRTFNAIELSIKKGTVCS